MGDIEKRLNTTAFKKAATWGTEVDVNVAGTGLCALNAGAIKHGIIAIDDKACGAFEHDLDQGDYEAVDFGLVFDLRYDGLENVLIAMIMGTAGAPAQQDTTDAYLHTLQMANSIADLFGTYATEKHDKIHVIPSAKPYKVALSIDSGKIKATINLLGDKVIDDSTTITAMDSVTTTDVHNRVLARQGVYRLNAQDGAAFDDGDKVKVKDMTIEIERRDMSQHYESESRSIIEPLEGDKPLVKVTLHFNRMDDTNDLYFSDWNSENEKKMDVVFTGANIESTYDYYHKLQFPRLKIEDVDYPEDSIIPASITMRALEADSAPTGMTGITKPVQWDIMNKTTTDLLA